MQGIPKHVKVALAVVGLGALLWMTVDLVLPKLVNGGLAKFESAMLEANAQGAAYGKDAAQRDCVREGARQAGECQIALTCVTRVMNFFDGCLSSAPDDPAFCRNVPDFNDDPAIERWTREACPRHGQTGDENCMMALSAVPLFCDSRNP